MLPMQSAAHSSPAGTDQPELENLRSVIESGFTHDWLLRVEYAGNGDATNHAWKEWSEPAFAITSAETVLEDVVQCRAMHPAHAIRLRAEKFNPAMRMLYCVYQPTETAMPGTRAVPPGVASMSPSNDWFGLVSAGMSSIGGRAWVAAAAFGILMSSVLLWTHV
jgi:ribulose bisphosphate carboxylase small subunit